MTHEKVGSDGSAHKNLNVWRTADGSLVAAFHKKNVTTEAWPAIQFDIQEKYLFFIAKDALVVYDMQSDFSKASYKVAVAGITQFAVSPSKKKVFAAFVPEGRGNKPAAFTCNEWSEGGISVNRKQFFRVCFWYINPCNMLRVSSFALSCFPKPISVMPKTSSQITFVQPLLGSALLFHTSFSCCRTVAVAFMASNLR